jgi:hypothetical protein
VWPAWLLAALSGDERSHVLHASTVNPFRQWEGAPAALTVRRVCRACNNGWMSELETLAQPIVTPLVFGESMTLDIEQQISVATWAIKASMLWEPASAIPHGSTLTLIGDGFTRRQCRLSEQASGSRAIREGPTNACSDSRQTGHMRCEIMAPSFRAV